MVIKKSVFVIVLFLSVFILFSLVSSVYAADVAYILKDDRFVKDEILDVFSDMGLSVEVIEDTQILTKNLANYKLVFVDDAILRRTKTKTIYNYPSVIMNKNYGQEWGLTDDDGISQLASTAPLEVKLVDNGVVQVYTQAKFSSGISLPYYYLSDLNKAPGFTGIARTYTGNTYAFGDVVAVAPEGTRLINGKTTGGRMCFYGIAETDYWTDAARNLFIDCVGSVLTVCSKNSDCDDNNIHTEDICINPGTIDAECIHNPIICFNKNECGVDGYVGSAFCSGNNILKNFKTFTCNYPGTSSSFCSDSSSPLLNKTCPYACLSGECIRCNEDSDCDDSNTGTDDKCINPGQLNSSCVNPPKKCFFNSDCGINFLSDKLCSGKNVVKNFMNFTCNNPGTQQAYCSNNSGSILVESCSQQCLGGACITINCTQDSDCNDGNVRTVDKCINPNTTASFCRNTEVNCLNNDDCGFTGFLENEFCFQNDVFKYYQNSTCYNPGTLDSSCSISVFPKLVNDCNDGNPNTVDLCLENPVRCEHRLIECDDNSDCSGGGFSNFCNGSELWNNISVPVCLNPGTIFSDCSFNFTENFNQTCEFGCEDDECLEGVHDVGLIDFSNSIEGIFLEYENGTIILDEPAILNCQDVIKAKIKVKNQGDFTENITFDGEVNGISFSLSDVENSEPGDTNFRSSLSPYITLDLLAGLYNIIIEAVIPIDNNPADNTASRQIEIICEELECTDGEIDTEQCGLSDVGECEYGEKSRECVEGEWEDWGECVGAVNPEEEICNQLDDDCDGLIDEGDVCEEECESNLIINVTYFNNYNPSGATKIADMSDNIFVAGLLFGTKEVVIPLTSSGLPIIDIPASDDVPGLSVIRGDDSNGSYAEISAYGFNHGKTRESIKFNIQLENSVIENIVNDFSVREFAYEKANKHGCGINEGKVKESDPENDEYSFTSTEADFCSTTNIVRDRVKIYYEKRCE